MPQSCTTAKDDIPFCLLVENLADLTLNPLSEMCLWGVGIAVTDRVLPHLEAGHRIQSGSR